MQENFNFFYQKCRFSIKIAHLWYVYCPYNPYFYVVRLTGLEPARRKTPDPKSGASTNSATGARERFAFGTRSLKRLQRYE